MGIKSQEKKGDVTIYTVTKDYTDEKAVKKFIGKKLKRSDIPNIITTDADVYDENGKIILKFRKKKIQPKIYQQFYDNVIDFAKKTTTARGVASGSKKKILGMNDPVMSNILGYFDNFSPKQNIKYVNAGVTRLVRETSFTMNEPEKYKKTIPLIKEVDKLYKLYVPENYKLQKKKAMETPFTIANTAFTTVTTNLNFQTNVHTDKGDDTDGFGNLTVIEHGEYTGGETCFPQYGIGIDVRSGDIAFMDVHQIHGNLPLIKKNEDAIRLSVVCYLRLRIWQRTKGMSKAQSKRILRAQYNAMKNGNQNKTKKHRGN